MTIGAIGCRPDVYDINDLGSVSVMEDEKLLELRIMNAMYASGFGYHKLFLIKTIPVDRPMAEVRKSIRVLPLYRDRSRLIQTANRVLSALDANPESLLCWIIGTDPLILAIGGPQGNVSPRGNDFTRQYPLVGSSDLTAPVHKLIIFPPGSWKQLQRADRSSDITEIDYDIIAFDRPKTIEQVFRQFGQFGTATH